MSPLTKALIAYTTKLRLVLGFHLLAAYSSCAITKVWFAFYFSQERELSIFYLLFYAILCCTKRCKLFKINKQHFVLISAKNKDLNLHTFVVPFQKWSEYFSPNAPIFSSSPQQFQRWWYGVWMWVYILRSYKINMVFEPLECVFVYCNVVQ